MRQSATRMHRPANADASASLRHDNGMPMTRQHKPAQGMPANSNTPVEKH
jgi:hypothetical protein